MHVLPALRLLIPLLQVAAQCGRRGNLQTAAAFGQCLAAAAALVCIGCSSGCCPENGTDMRRRRWKEKKGK
jgi:hypothetical protein